MEKIIIFCNISAMFKYINYKTTLQIYLIDQNLASDKWFWYKSDIWYVAAVRKELIKGNNRRLRHRCMMDVTIFLDRHYH